VDYARAFSWVPERMSPLELGVTLARADLRPSADCMRAKARNRPAEQQELSVWRPEELEAFALATFYGEGNLRKLGDLDQNEVIMPFGGGVIMEVFEVFTAEPNEGGLGLSGWATWERYLNDAALHAEFDALVEAGRKGLLEPGDWTVMPHFELFMMTTVFARFTVGAADVETYGDEIDKPLLALRWWYVSGVPSLNAAQRDQHGDSEFWSMIGDRFFPEEESASDFLEVLKDMTHLPQDRDVWVTLMGSTFVGIDAIRAQAFELFDAELSGGGTDLSFAEELEYPVQLLSVYGEPGTADALASEIEAHARAFPETPLARAILERAWPAPRR
jgi:hypothetical protein